MKSILFTHFKEKLLSREKQRTFRVLFIQKYIVGDTVKIDFKEGEKEEFCSQGVVGDDGHKSGRARLVEKAKAYTSFKTFTLCSVQVCPEINRA